jgi:hypothetical protein
VLAKELVILPDGVHQPGLVPELVARATRVIGGNEVFARDGLQRAAGHAGLYL